MKKDYGWLGLRYGGNNGCVYDSIAIKIIDQVKHGDHAALAEKDLFWQNQLRCFAEYGGGAHCYRKEF